MSLFLQQWMGELIKLFARRRTYIGFGAFILLETALLIMFRIRGGEKWFEKIISGQGRAFEHYYSALTLALIVLAFSVLILGALYIALVSGDIVAKENEDGHYRLLLSRPVSRLRLLFLKYLTCLCYTVVLIQFISWSAFLLGVLVRGWGGGFFAMAPEVGLMTFYEWGPGMERFALGSLFLSFSMMTVSSVAFFLSCLPIKPAAATIGALSYILIDMILRNMELMESYKHLLLTAHMGNWTRILADPIPWAVIIRSYTVLTAMCASLFIVGTAIFEARDLKS
ncbi:MAG: ABC transporter permease [Prosthecobacter sp.]|nr:ABC transporter permease [Prosthecobacter sp.]